MERFLDNYLLDFGSSFLLRCNYDVKLFLEDFPKFYKDCLAKWAVYILTNHSATLGTAEVLNEFFWNNEYLCVWEKLLIRKKLVNKGVIKLMDILSDTGLLKPWSFLKNTSVVVLNIL